MAKVIGSNKADVLHGTAYDDVINARGGDDTIVWSTGADRIDGGDGSDTMNYSGYNGELSIVLNGSTETAVTVNGEAGDLIVNIENLIGGRRDDYFAGDAANNTFSGNGGHDYFVGSDGFDTYYGGAGYDTVDYSKVNTGLTIHPTDASYSVTVAFGTTYDKLFGIENILGSRFGDQISGGSANNYFRGLTGADVLSGGAGGDVLDGGRGNDVLIGGGDADIFQFSGFFGKDVIIDFTAAGNSHDFVDLAAVDYITDFDDLMKNHISQQGDDVVIDANGYGSITLKNVDLHSLNADHFIF